VDPRDTEGMKSVHTLCNQLGGDRGEPPAMYTWSEFYDKRLYIPFFTQQRSCVSV
jgi:hypothetical protein